MVAASALRWVHVEESTTQYEQVEPAPPQAAAPGGWRKRSVCGLMLVVGLVLWLAQSQMTDAPGLVRSGSVSAASLTEPVRYPAAAAAAAARAAQLRAAMAAAAAREDYAAAAGLKQELAAAVAAVAAGADAERSARLSDLRREATLDHLTMDHLS